MSGSSQSRQPPGSPIGGQFAASTLTESHLDLDPLPSPRKVDGVVLPGSPSWQGVDSHRHLTVPRGAEPWFDVAFEGIEQLAQSTGTRWTITDAHGNADGVSVYVAERETGTLFHVEATATFTAAKVDQAAVSSLSMPVQRDIGRDFRVGDVAKNLRTVAASHRAMRALDNVLATLQPPSNVTRDGSGDTPIFRRGNGDVLQLDVDDTGLYVTTTTTHPVTGQPLNDSFEVTMSTNGSMQIERQCDGTADEEPGTAPGLPIWVDEMTSEEGLLWRACHSTHAAADRYTPAR